MSNSSFKSISLTKNGILLVDGQQYTLKGSSVYNIDSGADTFTNTSIINNNNGTITLNIGNNEFIAQEYTDPLAIKNTGANSATFSIRQLETADDLNFEYKLDSGSWIEYTEPVQVSVNSTIYLRGNNPNGLGSGIHLRWDTTSTASNRGQEVSGNPLSLIDKKGTTDDLTISDAFDGLFSAWDSAASGNAVTWKITLGDSNFFTARNLASQAYSKIFTYTETGPSSYAGVLDNSKTISQNIPAKVIPEKCFYNTFDGYIKYSTDAIIQFNLSKATDIGVNSLYFGGFPSNTYTRTWDFTFGKDLKDLARFYYLGDGTAVSASNIILRFQHGVNDPVLFDDFNLAEGGNTKVSITLTVYTDNQTIAIAALEKRSQYTTVNVYHLNGVEWVLPQLATPTIDTSAKDEVRVVTPITQATGYYTYWSDKYSPSSWASQDVAYRTALWTDHSEIPVPSSALISRPGDVSTVYVKAYSPNYAYSAASASEAACYFGHNYGWYWQVLSQPTATADLSTDDIVNLSNIDPDATGYFVLPGLVSGVSTGPYEGTGTAISLSNVQTYTPYTTISAYRIYAKNDTQNSPVLTFSTNWFALGEHSGKWIDTTITPPVSYDLATKILSVDTSTLKITGMYIFDGSKTTNLILHTTDNTVDIGNSDLFPAGSYKITVRLELTHSMSSSETLTIEK